MQSLYNRDIVVEEVLCEEKEERKSFPTSDSDILQPHSNEYGKPELVLLTEGNMFCCLCLLFGSNVISVFNIAYCCSMFLFPSVLKLLHTSHIAAGQACCTNETQFQLAV